MGKWDKKDELVDKNSRWHSTIEKRAGKEGKALLLIKLEPILTFSKKKYLLKNNEENKNPFNLLRNLK